MSENNGICVGAIVCIILIIAVTVAAWAGSNNAKQINNDAPTVMGNTCDKGSFFMDLPNEFTMEEQFLSIKSSLKVNKGIASFSRDLFTIGMRYTFRDAKSNVMAEATKGAFSYTYKVSRCNKQGPSYEISQHWFSIGSINYDLKKDGVLIAEPSKKTFLTCKPDIAMQDMQGNTLATIDRSCGESYFIDTWYITNMRNVTDPMMLAKKDTIENYVLGFMAFLTTVAESDAAAAKKKN